MTDPTPTPDGRFAGLPQSWSESARETYVQVEESHPDADPATLAVLFEACALIARADDLDALVETDGMMIDGYRSKVLHPAIPEARLARQSAMTHLRALGVAPGQSPASSAGAALASKRWHSSTSRRKSS
jgi:hypothetical protein